MLQIHSVTVSNVTIRECCMTNMHVAEESKKDYNF
jgi:hypothetical protein